VTPRLAHPLPALCLVLAVAFAACSKDDDPVVPDPGPVPVPDFALEDVNPTSATYGQAVSPRDQLEKVSAWYFGHAT